MTRHLLGAGLLAVICSVSALAADDDKEPKKKGFGLFGDPEAVFKKMDANGDGKVSKDEAKKLFEMFPKIGDKADQLLDRLFTFLDANKDDSLSLDEFKKVSEIGEKLKGKIDPEKLKKLKDKIDPEKLKQLLEKRKKDGDDNSEFETAPQPREKP